MHEDHRLAWRQERIEFYTRRLEDHPGDRDAARRLRLSKRMASLQQHMTIVREFYTDLFRRPAAKGWNTKPGWAQTRALYSALLRAYVDLGLVLPQVGIALAFAFFSLPMFVNAVRLCLPRAVFDEDFLDLVEGYSEMRRERAAWYSALWLLSNTAWCFYYAVKSPPTPKRFRNR
jgi:hypothetical protein